MTRVQNLMPSECLWLCTTMHVAAACLVHYSSVIASAQDFLDAILAVGQRAFPGSQPRRIVEQASEKPERARVPSDSIYPFLACRFLSNWPELDACLSPDDFSEAQNGQGHGDHVMKRERKEREPTPRVQSLGHTFSVGSECKGGRARQRGSQDIEVARSQSTRPVRPALPCDCIRGSISGFHLRQEVRAARIILTGCQKGCTWCIYI